MYPHERSLVQQLKGKPFAMIGVNSDTTVAEAKAAVIKNQLVWRSFQNKNEGGNIAEDWAVHGWPTLIVLDERMVIRYRGHSGPEASKMTKQLVASLTKRNK